MNMLGQCFSIAGTKVYSDPPQYYRGNGFVLGATMVGVVTALGFRFYLQRQNRRKAAEQWTEAAASLRACNVEEIGDRDPDFFYYL